MKHFFYVFVLLVIFTFFTPAQVQQINNTSAEPEDYVVPPFNISPGGGNSYSGNLLTDGVLVTTFPDFAGAATPMGVAFDGTYYYVIPGGYPSDDVAQIDASFNLVTTKTVDLDMRSIFYNQVDGEVYLKTYTNNGLYRLHTNPFDGGTDLVFTSIFQLDQTKAVLTWDGTTMYDQLDGNARSYDFVTGSVLDTFTLDLQHDLNWPRGNILAYSGTYLLTYAHPNVYAYDATNGSFISACNLGSQPSSDEWSICYTNGYFMLTDASDATWYVWAIDDGVPVELTSFTANVNNNQIELNWSTATETNNQGFEIQRNSGKPEFEKIGFVAGYGTTTEPHSYSYNDSNIPVGHYTYRLKQIDFDGGYEYSNEVSIDVGAPTEIELSQNYPNPFNPSTKIKYSFPQTSSVIIQVFDVLGNEIATLVNEEKLADTYEVEFNSTGLPSGIYFYQLKAGNFVSTKKMIFMK